MFKILIDLDVSETKNGSDTIIFRSSFDVFGAVIMYEMMHVSAYKPSH